jgi:hypothetical protein
MYNLTVAQAHTFFVGDGQWLVHNCGGSTTKLGGRYDEMKVNQNEEIHHMPANSVSPLSRGKEPAIRMDKQDHYQTSSWGSSKAAREYRAELQRLIDQGRFDDAIQMDIDDMATLHQL